MMRPNDGRRRPRIEVIGEGCCREEKGERERGSEGVRERERERVNSESLPISVLRIRTPYSEPLAAIITRLMSVLALNEPRPTTSSLRSEVKCQNGDKAEPVFVCARSPTAHG